MASAKKDRATNHFDFLIEVLEQEDVTTFLRLAREKQSPLPTEVNIVSESDVKCTDTFEQTVLEDD